MTNAEIAAIANWPLATLLVIVLVAGFRGWWIYGPQHDRLVKALETDRDEWKSIALDVTGLAKRAVRHLEGDQVRIQHARSLEGGVDVQR